MYDQDIYEIPKRLPQVWSSDKSEPSKQDTAEKIREIALFIERKGQRLIDLHGQSGYSTHCLEGELLVGEANAVLCVLDGVLPASWNIHLKEYYRETDPEYKDYLRLKEKFGNS
jgi:hypothetical protein